MWSGQEPRRNQPICGVSCPGSRRECILHLVSVLPPLSEPSSCSKWRRLGLCRIHQQAQTGSRGQPALLQLSRVSPECSITTLSKDNNWYCPEAVVISWPKVIILVVDHHWIHHSSASSHHITSASTRSFQFSVYQDRVKTHFPLES